MIALTLTALTLGYWGPNHSAMNYDVIENGTPFKFKRAGVSITKLDTYFERVLYLNDGVDKTVDGVKFFETPTIWAFGSYQRPGTDKPTDAPNHQRTAGGWMIQGGVWEDGFNDSGQATQWGGLRAVNHFHDPITESGYTGIRTSNGVVFNPVAAQTGRPVLDLLRKGRSVTEWVMGGSTAEPNHWGYPSAVDAFRKFFTETDRLKRSAGIGNAMRALGQMMHLVEDNTVPDHARDLAHPGEGWEEYLKGTNPGLFKATPKPWRVLPLKKIEDKGIRALWDRDVYTGVSPVPTLNEPVGIDEYVQANFLAWNVFGPWWYIAATGSVTEFTTIPEKVGEGFLSYRWPQLAPEVNGQYPSASPSLPLPCIAVPRVLLDPPYITGPCWKNYELPLMKIAHGYAQSVVTLAFPQGRAEMALAPANGSGTSVDPRRWVVRVWNLSSGDDAVTWHVTSAKIMGLSPAGSMGSREAVPLAGVSGDIPPSADPWVSPVVTLTPLQQQALNFTSHTVVVLEGYLGTSGTTQIPFVFGLPIPNGLPLVMQETTHINPSVAGSVATTNTQSCCNPMQCTACGEESEVHQPYQQTVTGRIKMMPTEVDLLGDPATADVKAAMAADARIAGLALVAYPQVMQPYFTPTQPSTHTLAMGNDMRFACAGSVCRRKEDTFDTADPTEFVYSFTLNIKELFGGAAAPPLATESVYLMVWTTAGAIYEWPVLLWPMYHDKTSAELIADTGGECGHAIERGLPGAEAAAGCWSTARQPSCGGATHDTWSRQVLVGPLVGLSTRLSDAQFFALPGLPRVLLFGGLPPTMTGSTPCGPPMTTATTANVVCISNSNSFIFKTVYDKNQSGPCPSIPPKPPLLQGAKYENTVQAEVQGEWKKLFGHRSYPKWVTDLD